MINKLIWAVAAAIWIPCIFSLAGGAFTYRENLPSGLYNRYILTMYKTLPMPPKGPAYCDFFKVGATGNPERSGGPAGATIKRTYALAFSCSGKPPFIGWLQGGNY